MTAYFTWFLHGWRALALGLLVLTAATGAAPQPVVSKATVYLFLSDTCPICQTSTLALRQLHATYAPQGVAFVGVFPEPQTRPADIILFQQQYQVPFPLRQDEEQRLTRQLQARITPEAVVVAPDGRILYQGRIDDSYLALGKRRTVVLHHELQDALAAVVSGQPVAVPRTEAVGCFIN
ncbi:redoxin domain-containing protein [Hymenobacter endophyticus]|uniref:Redoxin domain-containing protein n=1 Tax=Hymenobacter endophyticus TaxID=3076335 RepID=A0ABU3TG84_9BACT|nr:redoxin domain-containing protein [Hymenobacter endophyticus]MDU0370391.1 redoxin domain-containing protein [Hymenobacter endophyticus]